MTIDNPMPDRKRQKHSLKCKCGCRFSFERGEARLVKEPAKFLFIMCPECGKECSKCLDDEPKDSQESEFRFGGWRA